MSQAIAGYNGIGYLARRGHHLVPIIEMKDVTLKRTTKMLDATSHSSSGHEDYVPGVDGWTGTVAALTVFADALTADIESFYSGKALLQFRFDPAARWRQAALHRQRLHRGPGEQTPEPRPGGALGLDPWDRRAGLHHAIRLRVRPAQ